MLWTTVFPLIHSCVCVCVCVEVEPPKNIKCDTREVSACVFPKKKTNGEISPFLSFLVCGSLFFVVVCCFVRFLESMSGQCQEKVPSPNKKKVGGSFFFRTNSLSLSPSLSLFLCYFVSVWKYRTCNGQRTKQKVGGSFSLHEL